MKKILNGKLYDTETAKLLGTYSNGGTMHDFGHIVESLYLKKTGEFFLHGDGGPNTRYAVSQGENSWSGSEKIIPMSMASAREWAEKHLTAEEYEAIFGAVDEDEGYTLHSIKLTNATTERLRRAAREGERKIYEIVEEALRAYLQ